MGRMFIRDPHTVIPALVVLFIVIVAIGASWFAPHDPNQIAVGPYLEGPSWDHPAGTDNLGRDQLSRIIAGATISIKVAVVVAAVSMSIGLLIGLYVGYFQGIADFVVGRILDTMFAFPALLLALVLTTVRGASISTVMIALTIVYIPSVIRLVRSLVLAERERDYVRAALVTGAGHSRIVWLHIAPNIASPLIVLATSIMSVAVLAEASLSYLGFGAQPPSSSWGRMLTEGSPYVTEKPYLVIFPGFAIVILVLGLNLWGDALRDHLDPKSRRVADTSVTA
jgi:peptide/nickel transport system permease protein